MSSAEWADPTPLHPSTAPPPHTHRASSLALVCNGGKEADDGFTVGSWLVHIPGAVFLPSAPWPYQRPLKQQPVRLWQLASNSSYCTVTVRFPATPPCLVCVCVCLNICISEVRLSQCFRGSMLECIHNVFLWCINIQRKLTRVCLHVSGSLSKGGNAVSSREGKDLGWRKSLTLLSRVLLFVCCCIIWMYIYN